MRTEAAWFFAGICLLVTGSARARDASASDADSNAEAEARQSFDQGLEHFQAGDFDAAVADFEAAWRAKPHPSVLFNLGRAYAASERPVEAVRVFQQYLDDEGSALPAARRAATESLIVLQQRRFGTITVTSREPGVTVEVDGVVVGDTPLAAAVPVDPGSHSIVGKRTGSVPVAVTIRLDPSGQKEVELVLEPLPTRAPVLPVPTLAPEAHAPPAIATPALTSPQQSPARRSTTHWEHSIGAVALGVGIASSAFGTYFSLRAHDSWKDRNAHCVGPCDDQAVADWRDAKRFALAADISFALGIAAAGAGVYLLLAPTADAQKTNATRLFLGPRGDAWVVQLRGAL